MLTLSLVQPPQVWTWMDLRVIQAVLNELATAEGGGWADALGAI